MNKKRKVRKEPLDDKQENKGICSIWFPHTPSPMRKRSICYTLIKLNSKLISDRKSIYQFVLTIIYKQGSKWRGASTIKKATTMKNKNMHLTSWISLFNTMLSFTFSFWSFTCNNFNNWYNNWNITP